MSPRAASGPPAASGSPAVSPSAPAGSGPPVAAPAPPGAPVARAASDAPGTFRAGEVIGAPPVDGLRVFKVALLASAAALCVALFAYGVARARVAITLSLAAMMIAVSLNHGAVMLMRRGAPRWLANLVVTVLAVGLLTGLGFVVIPPAVAQLKLFVQQLPTLLSQARATHAFHMLAERFDIEQNLQALTEQSPGRVLAILNSALSAVAAAITLLFLAIFMLIFGGRLIERGLGEVPSPLRARYQRVADNIYESIGGYVAGLLVICTANAMVTTAFLAVSGMPFFLPLAIVSGLSSLVPYAGPFVTGASITLLALALNGPGHALATGIYFLIYGQLEGNVFGPLIFRRTAHVNPLVTTLSILFLGEMAGIVGAIAAVPLVAALQILLREGMRYLREHGSSSSLPAASLASAAPSSSLPGASLVSAAPGDDGHGAST